MQMYGIFTNIWPNCLAGVHSKLSYLNPVGIIYSVVSRMKQRYQSFSCHPERSRRIWDSSIPRSLPWAQSNGLYSEWQPTIHPWHDIR